MPPRLIPNAQAIIITSVDFARRLGASVEDAEDIGQDVALAWLQLIDPPRQLSSWLHLIVKRMVAQRARRAARLDEYDETAHTTPTHADAEAALDARRTIDRMAAKNRAALEVVATHTKERHVRKARARLRQRYQRASA